MVDGSEALGGLFSEPPMRRTNFTVCTAQVM